jgi:prefoldin subunit 5
MTPDDWMESVRRRTHDLSNRAMQQQQEITVLQQQVHALRCRITALEEATAIIDSLKHQAQVFRWLLAIATAVAIAVLTDAVLT